MSHSVRLSLSRGAFEHIAAFFNPLIASSNSILPGANVLGAALENLGQYNGQSMTWTCDFPSGELSHSVTRRSLECFRPGSYLALGVRDSIGEVALSGSFTVNPGSKLCFVSFL